MTGGKYDSREERNSVTCTEENQSSMWTYSYYVRRPGVTIHGTPSVAKIFFATFTFLCVLFHVRAGM